MSTIILIMCGAIDASLLENHEPWSQVAYSIFDEMASRGNTIAKLRKGELQKLANALESLPPPKSPEQLQTEAYQKTGPVSAINLQSRVTLSAVVSNENFQPFDTGYWPDETTAEQLMLIADSLDMDGFDWMTTSLGDSSAHSQVL